MTWFAVADRGLPRFSTHGLGRDRRDAPVIAGNAGTFLPAGTLMVEALITGEDRPETLLSFAARGRPARRSLELKAIPGGGVTLVHSLGSDLRHASLQHGGEGRMSTLRISYAWNTRAGWARLAVERPDEAQVFTARIDDPLPILIGDLHALITDPAPRSPNFVFAAVSTRIEPLGPTPTLSLAAPVATPLGYRAARTLRRGDLVVTRDGTQTPVLHALQRRVPARGSFRPIRLRAPYFGLQGDVIVAPSQRLVIGGSEVEYTFGVEAVLVPAGHLVNGTAALYEPAGPVTEYVQALLPEHEAMSVSGCGLESLYIGRLRRKPAELAASLLCNLPRASLPEHARPAWPVLGAFEAITLAEQRAA